MVTVRAALETLYCDRMSLSRAVPEPREDGTVFGREESLPGEIPCRLSYTGGFLERYRPEPLLPGEAHGLCAARMRCGGRRPADGARPGHERAI